MIQALALWTTKDISNAIFIYNSANFLMGKQNDFFANVLRNHDADNGDGVRKKFARKRKAVPESQGSD